MPLIVHRSNQLESLLEALARELRERPSSPRVPETLVVQSRGMQRWLMVELSRRLGAWAGGKWPMPRQVVEQILEATVGPPAERPFSREAMGWAIAAALPALLDQEPFAPLRRYLREGPGQEQRLPLGRLIAYSFDQYLVFRGDMLHAWERGEGEGWQPILWRKVAERLGPEHVATRARRYLASPPDTLHAGASLASLPDSLSVFGVSALPPIYLEVLSHYARSRTVHLYLLEPTRQWWGELPLRRQRVREQAEGAQPAWQSAAHWDSGHPLLEAWGRVGRDRLRLIERLPQVEEREEGWPEPSSPGVLGVLQRQLLELDRPEPSARPLLAEGDASISVHACHGALRQWEVLRDQLLDAFRTLPELRPEQVLVMTPDVDAQAPLIDAVFGTASSEPHHLPYRIADRTLIATSAVAAALLEALRVLRGDFTAAEVLDLLRHPPIAERFELPPAEHPLLRQWVDSAAIRWGVDGRERQERGLPTGDAFSWSRGLRRLLLGLAMDERDQSLFGELAPANGASGSRAVLLGRFMDFCQTLFDWRQRVKSPRPLAEWTGELAELTLALFSLQDEEQWQSQLVKDALRDLERDAAAGGFTEPLELSEVAKLLEEGLTSERASQQFFSGGITFCAMLPMRSIPFRVVALVGLDDGAFPRLDRAPSFDEIARERRQGKRREGDRVLKDEDRHLMLEALLSARERLIVTYTGRGIGDNKPRPPSAVVSELCEAIDASVRLEEGGRAHERLVFHHPLHAYSPVYFRESSRLFSYSEDHAVGAARLLEGAEPPRPFLEGRLAETEACVPGSVTELGRFLCSPVRTWMNERLGVRFRREEELMEGREPTELDALQRYQLAESLLARRLGLGETVPGFEVGEASRWYVATGRLPLGVPGQLEAERLSQTVEGLSTVVEALLGAERFERRSGVVCLGEARLGLELGQCTPSGRILVRPGGLRNRDRVLAWVEHLGLCSLQVGAPPCCTWLVGLERGRPCRERLLGVAPAQAKEWLGALVTLWREGQRRALPFELESAWRYVAALRRAEPDEEDASDRALRAARESYFGDGGFGTAAPHLDPYLARAFGDEGPFAQRRGEGASEGVDFPAVAEALLAPLLSHWEEA